MSKKAFPCAKCGADLNFDPGVATLKCPYCGNANEIPQSEDAIEELDFDAIVRSQTDADDMMEESAVTCGGCGATATLAEGVAADTCGFCGAALSAEPHPEQVLRPQSLLPFAIDQKKALGLFREWVNSLWFAPNALKNYAGMEKRLVGTYVPYWTYDSRTITVYHGERGDDYTETEKYTTVEDGKTVTKTRKVRKTRWTRTNGTVWNQFDDVLVLASNSLPRDITEALEPWDLENLVPYAEEYIAGFRAEKYQVDLKDGFEHAKAIMEPSIRNDIEDDIGGDRQRIHSMRTQYDNISFKHLLLPVWLSAYLYGDKTYRFVVNARTGEVQGERPWSWVKITLAVLGGLLVAGGVTALAMRG